MKKVSFAAFMICALSSVVAFADHVGDPDLKIQMDTPAGYKVVNADANTVVLNDPKDEVIFVLIKAADEKAAGAALNAFEEQLKKDVPDLHKTYGPQKDKTNGMDTSHMKFEGKSTKGDDTKVAVAIYKTPSGKFFVVAGAIKAKTQAAHQAEVQAFIQSIKPL